MRRLCLLMLVGVLLMSGCRTTVGDTGTESRNGLGESSYETTGARDEVSVEGIGVDAGTMARWEALRATLPYQGMLLAQYDSYPGILYADSEYIEIANYMMSFMHIAEFAAERERRLLNAFYCTPPYLPQPGGDPLVGEMMEAAGFVPPEYELAPFTYTSEVRHTPTLIDHVAITYERMYGEKLDLEQSFYPLSVDVYGFCNYASGGYGGPDSLPVILYAERAGDEYHVFYYACPYYFDGFEIQYMEQTYMEYETLRDALEYTFESSPVSYGVLKVFDEGFGSFTDMGEYIGEALPVPVYNEEEEAFVLPSSVQDLSALPDESAASPSG